MSYSEEKKPPALFFWGGGLEKLQGGLKEEEYFTSLTQNLMFKMGTKKDDAGLPNWDEFQKTLDNASLCSSSCMNKHKNALEEAFFLNETADNMKILHDRVQEEPEGVKTINILDELKSDSNN
ncbi:hypothetical protein KR200_006396 [Drosophila serrata]|nr:hypothetical protein KR200_006396 [Drosophila serrata]